MALVMTCPSCKIPTQFTVRTTSGLNQIWNCTVCGQVIYLETSVGDATMVDKGTIKDYYPKVIPKLDESIPDKINQDMKEAYVCYDNNCFKASVAMARRALQNAVRDKGAKGEDLYNEIENLASKHIITPELKDWAHEIRSLGNIGAHPEEDGLDEVSKEDAKDIINFASEFLKYSYVMPSEVAKRRAKREKV